MGLANKEKTDMFHIKVAHKWEGADTGVCTFVDLVEY